MARFCTNENIPLPVVAELRILRHDVLTSSDAGRANSAVPDHEVLAFATAENRILLSRNRGHFLQLHHHRTTPHAGMILCTVDPEFTRLARRIHEAVAGLNESADQLLRVNRPG